MAKLPAKTTEIVFHLKQQLLIIVDTATATELTLFNSFGETDLTISYLEELKSVAEKAGSRFSQLSTLQLQIAEAQPTVSTDMLELLDRAITQNQVRISAWERSIQEVKLEWNLL
jgi:hypothetical protein